MHLVGSYMREHGWRLKVAFVRSITVESGQP